MTSVKVTKAYKSYTKGSDKVNVLDGINLNVEVGSIYCLLGASGCGKTTLLQSIMGMKALDQGQIIVLGETLKPNKLPQSCLQIGFMPQENSLHDEMTVDEIMNFFGHLYHMDSDKLDHQKETLKKLLELPPDHQLICDCSGGQQRRISLSIALLNDPKLLILDEPTVGLDPILREKIWSYLVQATRSKQLSIIITTHYIEEAVQADRCGLMRNGILLDEDQPRLIMKRHKCETLEEAFLKLCVSKQRNEKQIAHSSEIEMDQLSNIQVANEKSEKIDFEISKRRIFRFDTMKALFYKNYLQNIRHPLNILVGGIFLVGAVLFNYTIGDNPKNLKLGIVDYEIKSLSQCYDPSLITTKINNDTGICHLNMVSCRFLEILTKEDFVDLIWFSSYDNAFRAAKRRDTVGFVTFSSNFSASTQALLESKDHENESELLDNREINIKIDETEFFLTLHMRHKFYESYHNYTLELMKDCNILTRLNLSPIQFLKPIYGKYVLDMKQYVGPVVTLVFYMFTFVAVTISTFIDERQKGIWNRTFLCGVELSEMIFAHIAFNMVAGVIHLFTFIPLMLWYYPATRTIGMGLIVVYYLLFGMMGMILGIMGGASFNDYSAALTFGSFFSFMLFFFSGFVWPSQALQKYLRMVVKYTLPTFIPTHSYSDIVHRHYDFSHKSVIDGIVVSILWIAILAFFTGFILRKKKFSN